MSDDDVIIEPEADNGEGGEATAEQKLKKLRDELKSAQKERDDNLAGWQRAKADYVNLERRTRALMADLTKEATASVVRSIVMVFDSLEAAKRSPGASPTLTQGIDAVVRQLEEALSKHGVSRFQPKAGEAFDPMREEAIQTLATDREEEDNTVTECFQSGYELEGTIIRPARVSVKHYQSRT